MTRRRAARLEHGPWGDEADVFISRDDVWPSHLATPAAVTHAGGRRGGWGPALSLSAHLPAGFDGGPGPGVGSE